MRKVTPFSGLSCRGSDIAEDQHLTLVEYLTHGDNPERYGWSCWCNRRSMAQNVMTKEAAITEGMLHRVTCAWKDS